MSQHSFYTKNTIAAFYLIYFTKNIELFLKLNKKNLINKIAIRSISETI